MDNIKDILFKEACTRVEPDIKETLLKEACTRMESFDIQPLIKEAEAKEAILSDGLMHIAYLDKESMGAYGGCTRYRAAVNLTVDECPMEDHKRLQEIKANIAENFAPLLIQRLKVGNETVMIDLTKDLKIDPNYLRLVFTKHLLPIESADAIKGELEKYAPGFSQLAQTLDNAGCPALPYYSKKCTEGGPGSVQQTGFYPMIKEWAAKMNAQLMSAQGQNDYLKQNPALKAFWQRFLFDLDKTPNSFPPVFQRLASESIKYPIEKLWDVNSRDELLWAVHHTENDSNKTMFSPYEVESKNKKGEWTKFVSNHFQPKIDSEEDPKRKALLIKKQSSVIEKVWKIFGETPPQNRNLNTLIKSQKKRSYPKDIEEYKQLTQEELKLLLEFLKAPELRFHAQPIKRPNGFDMPHIYPPILFQKGAKQGFNLDPEQGNMGLKFMSAHMDILAGQNAILEKQAQVIDQVYTALAKNVPDHPVMSSHTSADNLLFFLQSLQQSEMPQSLNEHPDFVNQIKNTSGPNSDTLLKFVGNLIGKIRGPEIQNRILQYGPKLFNQMTQQGSNGVIRGYQLGKILDVLDYVILKHLPQEEFKIYKVKDRNYSHAGVSGQIFLGVRGAYRVDIKDIGAGKTENAELLEYNKPTGAEYGMVSKTHLPVPGEESLPQMEQTQVYNEWGKAKITSGASYVLTQSSRAMTSSATKGTLRTLGKFDTLEEALSALQSAYPDAQRFIEERLNLIGQRLDLATKNIHAAVLKSIELKKALIEQKTGKQIVDESGQNITNAINKKEQEIGQLSEQIESEGTEEEQLAANPLPPTSMNEPYPEGSEIDPNQATFSEQQVGWGNSVAMQIAQYYASKKDYIFLKLLLGKGLTGTKLQQTWYDYYDKTKSQGTPSLDTFKDDIMSGKYKIASTNDIFDRLIKIADKFDKNGYIKVSNKIDLLITKLKER